MITKQAPSIFAKDTSDVDIHNHGDGSISDDSIRTLVLLLGNYLL